MVGKKRQLFLNFVETCPLSMLARKNRRSRRRLLFASFGTRDSQRQSDYRGICWCMHHRQNLSRHGSNEERELFLLRDFNKWDSGLAASVRLSGDLLVHAPQTQLEQARQQRGA